MMKLDPQEIRAAMDSRLSCIHASGARRARIREAIRNEGEARGKHRLTGAAAMASLAVALAAGVLLAAGLNLFAVGGKNDLRMVQNTPQAAFGEQAAFAAAHTATEEAAAYITGTYFNGSTLRVAYTVENGTRYEAFTPTGEQLADMRKADVGDTDNLNLDSGSPLARQLANAMENGTPFGLIAVSLWPDNRMWIGDGTELGHADYTQSERIGDAEQAVRYYESLKQDTEELKLVVLLWRTETRLYFDGTDLYIGGGTPEAAGSMTANAVRTDEPPGTADAVTTLTDTPVYALLARADSRFITVRMKGRGSYNGRAVQAELLVTPEASILMLVADAPGFAAPTADAFAQAAQDGAEGTPPDPVGDYWYGAVLSDLDGNTLYQGNVSLTDTGIISELFGRMDDLPEVITVTLLLHNWETAAEVMEPITLAPVAEAPDGDVFALTEQAAQYEGSAYIASAFYDGALLQLSCVIGGAQRFETFTPTPDQLQSMERVMNMDTESPESWPDDAAVRQYLDAVESGMPGGFVSYSVLLDQRTVTGEGITLAEADHTYSELVDGALYVVREYTNPQLAGDEPTVEIFLRLNATYLYFDGTDHYMANPARQEISAMAATVERADDLKRRMAGTGAYLGAPVEAEATVSPGYCALTLAVTGGELAAPDDTTRYDVIVRDGDGNALKLLSYRLEDAHTILAEFAGTGALPDTLTVEVLLVRGGAAATLIPPVALAPDSSQP